MKSQIVTTAATTVTAAATTVAAVTTVTTVIATTTVTTIAAVTVAIHHKCPWAQETSSKAIFAVNLPFTPSEGVVFSRHFHTPSEGVYDENARLQIADSRLTVCYQAFRLYFCLTTPNTNRPVSDSRAEKDTTASGPYCNAF